MSGGPKDTDGPLKILLRRMHHAYRCHHKASDKHTAKALQLAGAAYRLRRRWVCSPTPTRAGMQCATVGTRTVQR